MRSGSGDRTTPPTGRRPATCPRHPATRTARGTGRPAARREAPVAPRGRTRRRTPVGSRRAGRAVTAAARTGRGVPAARTARPWRETGGRAAW
ncbi:MULTISPECIES: hypothetical protein [Streptomyces]|uniref:hypothetical protein n=1 Tax=Streptomyces TaxID=1883 RepID=UPI0011D2B83C|nr:MULTISPECIES: hypothetical protein [Streptomyces]